MYDLHLSAEQLEIRDTVREFVTNEIKPVAIKPARMEALERRPEPDILVKAAQMGLRTLALSEAHGGAGADALTSCIVAEELAAGDPDVAAVLVETSMLGSLLFGVSPFDPLTYAAVALALGGVALLATWLPARQASMVDPAMALRAE